MAGGSPAGYPASPGFRGVPLRSTLATALFALSLSALGCSGGTTPIARSDTGDADAPLAVSEPTWRRHSEIGSLVYVGWVQQGAGSLRVEYAIAGEDWQSTPPADFGPGEHEMLVLGVPFATDFTVRVVGEDGLDAVQTSDVEATTGPLPDYLPVPELVVADPAAFEPTGKYLLASINRKRGGWNTGTYWKIILDRQGRVVWALVTPDDHWTIYQRIASDGASILWDEATWWSDFDSGAGSKVHRMKIDGSVLETVATPGLHHAFTELDDGTLVWGAADWYDENLVQRRPGGEVETLWRCRDWLETLGDHTECQSNALYWREDTDSFYYSFYTLNSILDIDRTSGDVQRVWGHLDGAYGFDPPESAFWWQHGVSWTPQGTLLTSTYDTEFNDELVVREYEVDDDAATLHQVWAFGEGQGVSGKTAGEAHRLPNGNTLHNYGSGSRLREVTTDGTVVWDVKWVPGHLLGRSVFIEDLYALAP